MPMPTAGAWPPVAHQPAYQAFRDWDAWYDGRAEVLHEVYRERGLQGARIRPSQLAGGVLGMFSRWLWGNPPAREQRDTRLHVPVPADLAATSAGLLFSERPTITAATAAVQAAVERLEEDGLHTVLRHAAEIASVLGDVYLRPVIDREVSPDRAIVTAVPADAAIPVIRWGRLVEVTFWSCIHETSGTSVRLLEHHDLVAGVGRIVYGLYEGTADQLGRPIPLTEHDATSHLAELVDEEGAQPTGLDRLDVVRVPNAGPQRIWRRSGALKYHGRSDMDGNEPLFDRVDEVWTSWMRDVRLARGRITVPAYMLQSNGPGQGAVWDADREVYSAVNALPDQTSGSGLTVTQFAIRFQEHQATIDALMEAAMRHAGLSAQTMGEEGDVAMTATEAQVRERRSFVTRNDRVGTWTPALAEYLELHFAVEAAAQLGDAVAAPERPNVEFGDSVSESPEMVARTAQLLFAAEAASTETLVRMVHPDWDDTQVDEEVRKIQDASATGQEPELTLGGLAGNQPGEDQVEEPEGGPEEA
jgi:hypothetical protein